ncbi:MAG TPA: hypothetical protein VGB53_07020 [Rubricoccaceae bacterium]
MTAHVLLVDPAPDGPLDALAGLAGLDATPVTTLAAARAYLSGSTFDVVAIRQGVDPDASLRALVAGLGSPGEVVEYDDPGALRAALAARFRLQPAPASGTGAPAAEAVGEVDLAALRADLARVAHDLANPLAVVVGNAQLGAEIARATGADASLVQAFADIEEGAAELGRRIGALATLRARLGGPG